MYLLLQAFPSPEPDERLCRKSRNSRKSRNNSVAKSHKDNTCSIRLGVRFAALKLSLKLALLRWYYCWF